MPRALSLQVAELPRRPHLHAARVEPPALFFAPLKLNRGLFAELDCKQAEFAQQFSETSSLAALQLLGKSFQAELLISVLKGSFYRTVRTLRKLQQATTALSAAESSELVSGLVSSLTPVARKILQRLEQPACDFYPRLNETLSAFSPASLSARNFSGGDSFAIACDGPYVYEAHTSAQHVHLLKIGTGLCGSEAGRVYRTAREACASPRHIALVCLQGYLLLRNNVDQSGIVQVFECEGLRKAGHLQLDVAGFFTTPFASLYNKSYQLFTDGRELFTVVLRLLSVPPKSAAGTRDATAAGAPAAQAPPPREGEPREAEGGEPAAAAVCPPEKLTVFKKIKRAQVYPCLPDDLPDSPTDQLLLAGHYLEIVGAQQPLAGQAAGAGGESEEDSGTQTNSFFENEESSSEPEWGGAFRRLSRGHGPAATALPATAALSSTEPAEKRSGTAPAGEAEEDSGEPFASVSEAPAGEGSLSSSSADRCPPADAHLLRISEKLMLQRILLSDSLRSRVRREGAEVANAVQVIEEHYRAAEEARRLHEAQTIRQTLLRAMQEAAEDMSGSAELATALSFDFARLINIEQKERIIRRTIEIKETAATPSDHDVVSFYAVRFSVAEALAQLLRQSSDASLEGRKGKRGAGQPGRRAEGEGAARRERAAVPVAEEVLIYQWTAAQQSAGARLLTPLDIQSAQWFVRGKLLLKSTGQLFSLNPADAYATGGDVEAAAAALRVVRNSSLSAALLEQTPSTREERAAALAAAEALSAADFEAHSVSHAAPAAGALLTTYIKTYPLEESPTGSLSKKTTYCPAQGFFATVVLDSAGSGPLRMHGQSFSIHADNRLAAEAMWRRAETAPRAPAAYLLRLLQAETVPAFVDAVAGLLLFANLCRAQCERRISDWPLLYRRAGRGAKKHTARVKRLLDAERSRGARITAWEERPGLRTAEVGTLSHLCLAGRAKEALELLNLLAAVGPAAGCVPALHALLHFLPMFARRAQKADDVRQFVERCAAQPHLHPLLLDAHLLYAFSAPHLAAVLETALGQRRFAFITDLLERLLGFNDLCLARQPFARTAVVAYDPQSKERDAAADFSLNARIYAALQACAFDAETGELSALWCALYGPDHFGDCPRPAVLLTALRKLCHYVLGRLDAEIAGQTAAPTSIDSVRRRSECYQLRVKLVDFALEVVKRVQLKSCEGALPAALFALLDAVVMALFDARSLRPTQKQSYLLSLQRLIGQLLQLGEAEGVLRRDALAALEAKPALEGVSPLDCHLRETAHPVERDHTTRFPRVDCPQAVGFVVEFDPRCHSEESDLLEVSSWFADERGGGAPEQLLFKDVVLNVPKPVPRALLLPGNCCDVEFVASSIARNNAKTLSTWGHRLLVRPVFGPALAPGRAPPAGDCEGRRAARGLLRAVEGLTVTARFFAEEFLRGRVWGTAESACQDVLQWSLLQHGMAAAGKDQIFDLRQEDLTLLLQEKSERESEADQASQRSKTLAEPRAELLHSANVLDVIKAAKEQDGNFALLVQMVRDRLPANFALNSERRRPRFTEQLQQSWRKAERLVVAVCLYHAEFFALAQQHSREDLLFFAEQPHIVAELGRVADACDGVLSHMVREVQVERESSQLYQQFVETINKLLCGEAAEPRAPAEPGAEPADGREKTLERLQQHGRARARNKAKGARLPRERREGRPSPRERQAPKAAGKPSHVDLSALEGLLSSAAFLEEARKIVAERLEGQHEKTAEIFRRHRLTLSHYPRENHEKLLHRLVAQIKADVRATLPASLRLPLSLPPPNPYVLVKKEVRKKCKFLLKLKTKGLKTDRGGSGAKPLRLSRQESHRTPATKEALKPLRMIKSITTVPRPKLPATPGRLQQVVDQAKALKTVLGSEERDLKSPNCAPVYAVEKFICAEGSYTVEQLEYALYKSSHRACFRVIGAQALAGLQGLLQGTYGYSYLLGTIAAVFKSVSMEENVQNANQQYVDHLVSLSLTLLGSLQQNMSRLFALIRDLSPVKVAAFKLSVASGREQDLKQRLGLAEMVGQSVLLGLADMLALLNSPRVAARVRSATGEERWAVMFAQAVELQLLLLPFRQLSMDFAQLQGLLSACATANGMLLHLLGECVRADAVPQLVHLLATEIGLCAPLNSVDLRQFGRLADKVCADRVVLLLKYIRLALTRGPSATAKTEAGITHLCDCLLVIALCARDLRSARLALLCLELCPAALQRLRAPLALPAFTAGEASRVSSCHRLNRFYSLRAAGTLPKSPAPPVSNPRRLSLRPLLKDPQQSSVAALLQRAGRLMSGRREGADLRREDSYYITVNAPKEADLCLLFRALCVWEQRHPSAFSKKLPRTFDEFGPFLETWTARHQARPPADARGGRPRPNAASTLQTKLEGELLFANLTDDAELGRAGNAGWFFSGVEAKMLRFPRPPTAPAAGEERRRIAEQRNLIKLHSIIQECLSYLRIQYGPTTQRRPAQGDRARETDLLAEDLNFEALEREPAPLEPPVDAPPADITALRGQMAELLDDPQPDPKRVFLIQQLLQTCQNVQGKAPADNEAEIVEAFRFLVVAFEVVKRLAAMERSLASNGYALLQTVAGVFEDKQERAAELLQLLAPANRQQLGETPPPFKEEGLARKFAQALKLINEPAPTPEFSFALCQAALARNVARFLRAPRNARVPREDFCRLYNKFFAVNFEVSGPGAGVRAARAVCGFVQRVAGQCPHIRAELQCLFDTLLEQCEAAGQDAEPSAAWLGALALFAAWGAEPATGDLLRGVGGGTALLLAGPTQTGRATLLAVNSLTGEVSNWNEKDALMAQGAAPFVLTAEQVAVLAARAQKLKGRCWLPLDERGGQKQLLCRLAQRLECALLLDVCLAHGGGLHALPRDLVEQLRGDFSDGTTSAPQAATRFVEAMGRAAEQRSLPLFRPEKPPGAAPSDPALREAAAGAEFTETPSSYFSGMAMSHPHHSQFKMLKHWEKSIIPRILGFVKGSLSNYEIEDFFEQIRIELRKEDHIRASNIAYVLCDQRLPTDCKLPAFNHDWSTCELGELRPGQWVSVRARDERSPFAPALLAAARAGVGSVLGQVLLKDYTHNLVGVLVQSLDQQHSWTVWVPQQAVRLPEVALAPPTAGLSAPALHRDCDEAFRALWSSLVRGFFLRNLEECVPQVAAGVELLLASMSQRLADADVLTGWVTAAEHDRRHNDIIRRLYEDAAGRQQLLAAVTREAERLARTLSARYVTDLASAEGDMLALHRHLGGEDVAGAAVEFKKSASLFKCSGLRFYADAEGRVTLAQLQATQKKSLGQLGPLLFHSREVFAQFYSNEEALPVFARSERNTNLECCVYALSRRWNAFFWLIERLSLLAAAAEDAEAFEAVAAAVVRLCKQLHSPGAVRAQLLNFFGRLLLRLRQAHLRTGRMLADLDASMRADELRLGEISALLVEEGGGALPSLRQQQAAEFLSIYRAHAQLRGVELPAIIPQNPIEEDISTLVALCEMAAGCAPDARLRGLLRDFAHPRAWMGQLVLVTQLPALPRAAVSEALEGACRAERFKLLCPELDVYIPTDSAEVCVSFAVVLFDGLAAPHVEQAVAEEVPAPEAEPEPLQWYCDTCTLLNPDTVDVCAACEMPKPHHPTYAETAAPPEKKERDWPHSAANRQHALIREIGRAFERLTPDRRICVQHLDLTAAPAEEHAFAAEIDEFLMFRITHDRFSARLPRVFEEIFHDNEEYLCCELNCASAAELAEQMTHMEPLALFERLGEFGYDPWLERTGLSAHNSIFALPERHDLARFREFLEQDVCANTLFITEVRPRDFRLEFKSPLPDIDVFADRALERLRNPESRAFYAKHMRLVHHSNLHFRCAVAFLRLLNDLFERRYMYLDLLSPATNGSAAGLLSVGALVSRNRDLLFSAVKNSVVQELLRNTALVRDETPKVVVDRLARETAGGARGAEERGSELMQAFRQLGDVSPTLLRPVKPKGSEPYICFEVVFKGEHVMGDAGPYRQFFADISAELQPECGSADEGRRLPLFIPTPNQQSGRGDHKDKVLPSPGCASARQLQLFEFVGVLMGCCFRTRTFLALELPALLWKRMVRQPLTEQDLDEVDQGLTELLRFLRTCPAEVFEEHIFESFTAALSDKSVAELLPGGARRRVAYADRLEYADRVAEARLNESRAQIEAIRRGMARIVPEAVLGLLTHADLEEKVCGQKTVDFELLRKHTRYSGGLAEDAPLIRNFWEVLFELTDADKRRFVKFCWGQERLPLSAHSYEHSSTRFLVKPAMYPGSHDGVLPKADTCFFNFELPNYSCKEVMRERILLAIHTDADSMNAEEREFEQNLQYDENNATFYSDLSE